MSILNYQQKAVRPAILDNYKLINLQNASRLHLALRLVGEAISEFIQSFQNSQQSPNDSVLLLVLSTKLQAFFGRLTSSNSAALFDYPGTSACINAKIIVSSKICDIREWCDFALCGALGTGSLFVC